MQPEIEVLHRAGLRPSHISRLLDVSRNTAMNWYSGGTPHRWIIDRVRVLSNAVSRAIEAGKLPVHAPDLNADEHAAKTFFIASRFFQEEEEGDATT